ncbi:MAG: pilus assembly protein PilM [bacterium]
MNFKLQKQKQWQQVLGLDYSSQSLKYVLVKRNVRGIKVDSFGKYTFKGENKENEVERVLGFLLKDNKYLRKSKIVIGLDNNDLVLKTESFPNLSRKEILQSITFALQREISQEGIETEIICDYRPVSGDIDKSNYITMGVPEDIVVSKVGPIVAQEVTPSKVIPTIVSLLNLLQFIPGIEEVGEFGLMDIGATRSMLIFIKDGKIEFYREILVGGDDFTKGITGTIFHEGRAVQLISDEAVEFKLKYGYPQEYSEGMTFRGAPIGEIGTMMRPVVERLIGEIKRSIGFFKDKSESGDINRLYLLGGGAQLKNLSDVLLEKLDLPVFPLPFPENIYITGKKEQKEIFREKYLEQAVSFSLALEEYPEGNLLPEIYKKIHKASAFKRYALMFIGLFTFILLLIWWMGEKDIDKLEIQVERYEKRISTIRNAQSNAQRLKVMQQKEKELLSQISELNASYGQDESLIQVLKLVSHATPENCMILSYDYAIKKVVEETDSRAGNKKEEKKEEEKTVVTMYLSYPDPPKDVEIIAFKYIVDLEKSGFFSDVNLTIEDPEKSDFLSDIIKVVFEPEKSDPYSNTEETEDIERYFLEENIFMFKIEAVLKE